MRFFEGPAPGNRRGPFSFFLAGIFAVSLGAAPLRAEMAGHGAMVNAIAVSPDGTRVLTGSWDYTLRLWDLRTQGEVRAFNEHAASVNGVAFLPDGRHALSAS